MAAHSPNGSPHLFMNITQDYNSFTVDTRDSDQSFIKGDIYEAKRLLDFLIYTLGLNTDTHKINIKVSGK